MTWREAFLRQARSDHDVLKVLVRERVQHSHQLHYFQMFTEKLSKGLLTPPSATEPPALSHAALVRCLRVIKTRPEIRRKLGHDDSRVFGTMIDSLLPLAEQIERLAPSLTGTTQPNPEYPWQQPGNSVVISPVDFDFSQFDPRKPQMAKLEKLLKSLLGITQ